MAPLRWCWQLLTVYRPLAIHGLHAGDWLLPLMVAVDGRLGVEHTTHV